MSDLRTRLTKQLEPILLSRRPAAPISAYHDMPYALFRYDPDDELELRKELTLLTIRLEQAGKRVTRISLAECLEEAMTSIQPLDDWFEAERREGTDTIVETIHAVLAEHAPLDDLVAQRMPADPNPLSRRRPHPPRRRPVPRVPHLHPARAAEGPRRRPDRALLPGHTRRRRRAAVHGRPRRRAQLPTEDLLTDHRKTRVSIDMTVTHIKDLFANDVERPIEEVIKVDQTDEEVIKFEIDEYVVTDAIAGYYASILDVFNETPNKPRDGIGVWVSGFFGSGKSSFAKMLGLALENRDDRRRSGRSSASPPARTPRCRCCSSRSPRRSPSTPSSSTCRPTAASAAATRPSPRSCTAYCSAASATPRTSTSPSSRSASKRTASSTSSRTAFREITGKEWDARKELVAFSLGEASAAMHRINPAIYQDNDSWSHSAKGKADINPGKLAERASELIARRKPDHTLVFVVDEVGQFVARDVQKMLDLQAIVQQLGVKGRGKHWLVVTSQEKLNELTAGLDDKKVELARLMDRFPQQVHLEPSDISEVTSKRVLAKNAAAQQQLGELYEQHRGQLASHTKLSADITLPELSRAAFIDLYPLMPYQIDLIIQVVSGLRTQGGASKHVGGANRTIIKLAQQLLIHPDVGLAQSNVGDLVRLDEIYDLVESNIDGEIRAKIRRIPEQVSHPLAASVAKSVCLLQFVQSVHRTAENIAACLYPSLGAPSELESVKDALQVLEHANLVRKGDDGYRIPTPAEDDWDRLRNGTSPKPSDAKRLHREILTGFLEAAADVHARQRQAVPCRPGHRRP